MELGIVQRRRLGQAHEYHELRHPLNYREVHQVRGDSQPRA